MENPRGRTVLTSALALMICVPHLSAQAPSRIPRAPDGHPDLQGVWTNGTVTPLQRPQEFAVKEFLAPEEAAEYERTALDRLIQSLPEVDRTAADLNYIYLDRHQVVEGGRTSLIVDPRDGRFPPLVSEAQKRVASRQPPSSDDPETRLIDERCLSSIAFGASNASPPIVPNPFAGNFYQIVQTPRHIVIHSELIHDARIVRLADKHLPSAIRHWLGDSIGRWEGDTLVVDTTNFNDKLRWRGSTPKLHVVERFTRTDAKTIRYRVTVEDSETWSAPWTAEIPFKATSDRIFEYACHEANYSLANALRGARAEEKGR